MKSLEDEIYFIYATGLVLVIRSQFFACGGLSFDISRIFFEEDNTNSIYHCPKIPDQRVFE